MDKQAIQKEIEKLVVQYFSAPQDEFIPGVSKVSLTSPSYGAAEVNEALDSLLSTWVTMGKKVSEFERLFSSYVGTKHGLMVNSGSSANLIALSALSNPLLKNHMKPGDEVIAPSCTWSTTIYPIINVHATPVLADVRMGTFDINPDDIEKAITPKTRAIMPVHLLGAPCDMKRIMEIARKHNLFVIEDTCESHGAEYNGKKVGSFGDFSTFSFFLSHHITTIEGGIVLSNNDDLMELARPLRAHGWVREMKGKDSIIAQNPHIDSRFLFYTTGYNFRPTEVQGAFGMHQMKKLDEFIDIRRKNMFFWLKEFDRYRDYFVLPEEPPGTKNSSFCFPMVLKDKTPFTKKELVDFLESKKIETRQIEGANMIEHPSMRHLPYRQVNNLPNSHAVLERGFFFGNHQAIGKKEREYVAECVHEFMKRV